MPFFNENNNKIKYINFFVLAKEVTRIRPSDLDLTKFGHASVRLGIRRSGKVGA